MFGNKTKKVGTISEPPVGLDIYTSPDDWGEEPIKPFTAKEANEMAHDYTENAFEELKAFVFSNIEAEANAGRFRTCVNSWNEETAVKLCEYLKTKGYEATYKSNSVYGQNHVALQVSYTINISWGDDDEDA